MGWSVVVTGVARLVTDSDQITHYEHLVAPWISHTMQYTVLGEPGRG